MNNVNDNRHMKRYLEIIDEEGLPSKSILEKLTRININRLLEAVMFESPNEIICLRYVKTLIEKYGADPKAKFYDNYTPLHLAAINDYSSVFFYLLPYSNISAKDVSGQTALDIVNVMYRRGNIALRLSKNEILRNIPAAKIIKSSRLVPEIKTNIIKNLFGSGSLTNKFSQPKYKKCGFGKSEKNLVNSRNEFGMDYSVPGVLGGLGGTYVQPNIEFGKVMKWAKNKV